MDTGNPLDKAVNTWHLLADDEDELESGGILALNTFYNAIDGSLSNLVDPTAGIVRAYDLADPEPRAPVLEQAFTIGATGGNTSPPELAICVSFEAPQQSGQPQARRRGRVYIGPLSAGAWSTTTGMLTTETLDGYEDAMQDLIDTSANATTWALMVYSRVNAAAVEALHMWVDNAVDIQRRRGLAATDTRDVEPVFP